MLSSQKANRPDDEIKRGDERPLCGENNNTITFTFMIMQMLYYAVKKEIGNYATAILLLYFVFISRTLSFNLQSASPNILIFDNSVKYRFEQDSTKSPFA